MSDLGKAFNRLLGNPLGGRIGRNQFRMFGLQLLEPCKQTVIFTIADGRGILDIVQIIMPSNLLTQLLYFTLYLFLAHKSIFV